MSATTPPQVGGTATPRVRAAEKMNPISKTGDLVFSSVARVNAWIITILVVLIAAYLIIIAVPAMAKNQGNFFGRTWNPNPADPTTYQFGIVDMLWTTVLSSIEALVIAVPLAMGIALFITQVAPKRIANSIAFIVDLLAAVPSVIFGLWGLLVLAPQLQPVRDFLVRALGWFPLFGKGLGTATGTVFVGGLVLAIMILPIVTAMCRDVYSRTPRDHIEAALALGATKWEVIRLAVLPYGKSGTISGAMLGLGRALGETVAVMIILSAPAAGSKFDPSVFAGGETFASKIAASAAEFDSPLRTGAYVSAALVLFILTFIVNVLARVIAERKVKS